MLEIRFSRLAETDLFEIGAFTLQQWGERQALQYLGNLEACCRRLAGNPELGRRCDHIRPGLRRMEHGRHVIFYRLEQKTIRISRILHQSMLPERQSIDEE